MIPALYSFESALVAAAVAAVVVAAAAAMMKMDSKISTSSAPT